MSNINDKYVTVLGSTGSIGTQALDVCAMHAVRVEALSANVNSRLTEQQARRFGVKYCAMKDIGAARDLKARLSDTSVKVFAGSEGIIEMISMLEGDTVLNSIIGSAGLMPTVAAIENRKNIALANKETLVTAGALVKKKALENGVAILPVDSEHSAIFQCLQNGRKSEVARLILTASGGPFFGMSLSEMREVSVEQAIAHPTWSMGRKISLDSATMMNKCFEIIEAACLFDMPSDRIDVVIHRESVVHSMVEYIDGSIIAQMSLPDMRLCIRYALSYPERVSGGMHTDLTEVGKLTFAKPDRKAFSALDLAAYALDAGGVIPAVLNGASEGAAELFFEKKILFTEITGLVSEVVHNYNNVTDPTLEEIIEAGEKAKREAIDRAQTR